MSKEDYHGKGEQDARDDEYRQPHSDLDLTNLTREGREKNTRENEEYDKGYYHGKGQQDASEGEYHRPHSDIDLSNLTREGREKNKRDNDAYDAGHDSSRKQKSGCFLTTACTEAAGLPDTCHELTVLRHFRDCYLAQRPRGAAMIAQYYAAAPRIVEQIQQSPQRAAVFDSVFADVRRAVTLIESDEQESALSVYAAMFTRLQLEFDRAA